MARKGKIKIGGRYMSVKSYADACAFNRGCSNYIKARRDARNRARQIRAMNGPASMEWVQSALFMYAVKKHGLVKDLRRAIWAYTSALVLKLEDLVTNTERIAERDGIADTFHWMALQLRAAIREHMKLLDMLKDSEPVNVPEVTTEGRRIAGITHYPTDKDSYESMSYIISEYSRQNPDAEPFMPKKDSEYPG